MLAGRLSSANVLWRFCRADLIPLTASLANAVLFCIVYVIASPTSSVL